MQLPKPVKDRLRTPVLLARRLRADGFRPADVAWAQPRSFSQFGEDRWLARHFEAKPSGFYVDVGAFHPFHASNTYGLYRQGWRGINLEPAVEGLAALTRHRPRDINLPWAVSERPGPVTFVLSGAFAGIDDDEHLWPGMAGERVTVQARTLSDILDEHLPTGQEIDLLDVDCEGHDLDVLRSNDWDRYRPGVVLAEFHDGHERAGDPGRFLAERGYELLTRLDLTCVFGRQD